MKTLQFTEKINAPASRVYDAMLGLQNKETYNQWTAVFNPTSTYEGSWNKGSKIYFTGTDEKGEKGGMVSEIADNVRDKFVSIRHRGLLKGTEEITEGPEVEKWAGGFENYSFEENNGVTTVKVEVDATEDFEEHMSGAFPSALAKLKEICEK